MKSRANKKYYHTEMNVIVFQSWCLDCSREIEKDDMKAGMVDIYILAIFGDI